jgi:hypothetical protein
MSLYVTPKQSILDAANALNGTSLLLTDIAFETPKAAPDDVVTTTGKNTQVRINGNGKTWTGTVVVNYNRLKLSDIITLTSNTLRVAALTSTLEVMNYLNYFYGMALTADDIKDEPVTLNENGSGTVTINAKPDSYGWIGSVTLNLVKGDAIVDFAVTDLSLDGIDYPTKQFAKGQAPLVAYPYDFTSIKSTLDQFTVGYKIGVASSSVLVTALLAGLNSAINNSSFSWGSVGSAAVRNLVEGIVAYNGLNSSEFISNQEYKYVMILQLSDGSGNNGVVGTFCTDFVGKMYFHYNDPVQ